MRLSSPSNRPEAATAWRREDQRVDIPSPFLSLIPRELTIRTVLRPRAQQEGAAGRAGEVEVICLDSDSPSAGLPILTAVGPRAAASRWPQELAHQEPWFPVGPG